MSYKVIALPGDGIGKIVLAEALRVLDAVGFEAEYIEGDIGWEFWVKEGNPLPDRTIELLEKHRVGLFGAITSKPKDIAGKELSPELQDKGLIYYSPIVGLRQHFNLDICIRPCKTFKGNPLNFIRRTSEGFEEPEIDVVVFRQNTEGLYAGVEWTNPPEGVRKALETHPKMKNFKDVLGEDLAISLRIFTRTACKRIIREAFEYAKKFGYDSVTIAEKPNVIRETSGMMREEAKKIASEYPDIYLNFTNIDAQMMWMTKNPEDYGIIVAGNMFGDIVSDGFAGLTGGLGFARSANIGEGCAIFEPTHGSAPKYAELEPSIVSPFAMILSSIMMLDYLGECDKANTIRKAIEEVVVEGKISSYDMLKLKGGPDVLNKGAASTKEITDAIIEKL
ncbi:isocitrate/isopropylmalate dehydrogenase family protein [candidate division WOR-3 bacterium]|nr:isocitrate/isopropylmalate dehydrogenase family protein [candidate division WOR-3 bacterium]MCK4528281.1 isocitrate/isopropylmalate dehydrogenase family protein [candidate division WOR-3 bacterium]